MSEMVERVAQALFEDMKARLGTNLPAALAVSWLDLGLTGKMVHRREAMTAIAAMREPTEAMVLACAKSGVDQIYYKSNAWERRVSGDKGLERDYLNFSKFGLMAAIDEALK